ncbi:MAG TPA: hypothetical protein VGF56_03700 [Rhizomicrobium sp.]|jgi:hypothetical protein
MSPRLYIVSRPQPAEGLATFLAHRGLAWPPAPDSSPAEQLIAFLARLATVDEGGRPEADIAVARDILERLRWTFLLEDVSAEALAALGAAPPGRTGAAAVTADAAALRDYLLGHGAGDEGERIAAALIHQMLVGEAPVLIADLVLGEMEDGSPIVRQK